MLHKKLKNKNFSLLDINSKNNITSVNISFLKEALDLQNDIDSLNSLVFYLEKLIFICKDQANKIDSKKQAEALCFLINLQAQALAILKMVLNAESNKKLELRLLEREVLKKERKMPISFQQFNKNISTKHMLENQHFNYDIQSAVVMYDKKTRESRARIFIYKGKFYQLTINTGQLTLKPLYTDLISSNMCLLVDSYGNMYCGKYKKYSYHHSSYVGGDPVFFAGIIKTDKQGNLIKLTNKSGHYRTPEGNAINFVKHLYNKGALSNHTSILIKGRGSRGKFTPRWVYSMKDQLVIKKIHDSIKTKVDFKQWMTTTFILFSTRHSLLKEADYLLKKYHNNFDAKTIDENLNRIVAINAVLKNYETKYPKSRRAKQIKTIKQQLEADKVALEQLKVAKATLKKSGPKQTINL